MPQRSNVGRIPTLSIVVQPFSPRYVDDKTKLPEEEWIIGSDGKEKKSIGRVNADFQISKFNTNAQPYYCLMGHNGELLVDPRAYDLDKDAFVDFLKQGVENFNNGVFVRNIFE